MLYGHMIDIIFSQMDTTHYDLAELQKQKKECTEICLSITQHHEYRGYSVVAQEILPGQAYIAIRGRNHDGHQFINEAITRGAKWILYERGNYSPMLNNNPDVSYVPADNTRMAASSFAFIIYPQQPAHIAAVTGTKGKTSASYLATQITALLGYPAGYIGTEGALLFNSENKQLHYDDITPNDKHLTTPDPDSIHKLLSKMHQLGYQHLFMEASSHALDQSRIANVNISSAAFTNLGHDHLDYHLNFDQYFAAKKLLYTFMNPQHSILNADIPQFASLSEIARDNGQIILDYGYHGQYYRIISFKPGHSQALINGKLYNIEHNLSIIHSHNLAAAILLAHSLGSSIDDIITVIPHLLSPPGRMEKVTRHNGADIYVDFAHTPESLDIALQAIRAEHTKRLILVFGCGGDRDKLKRPKMGAIANALADITIITDDNPRNEDPSQIRLEIKEKCPSAIEIGNREEAIGYALSILQPGDALLIAGRGTETHQKIGNQNIPCNDKKIILSSINQNL